jgi:hypothetical protein
VDAFYYPDRDDLTDVHAAYELADIKACQDWVFALANVSGDASLSRGDYECGIGLIDGTRGIRVYRNTIR